MSLNMSITVGKLKTCKYVHNRMLILHLNNIDLGIKLGFFRLNAEYHVSEFDAFSVGINFGFR